MEMYVNAWKCIEMYGNAWKCIETHGNVWKWSPSQRHWSLLPATRPANGC